MRLKIKWNDDRVRGATMAILLIARDRLVRGETLADMIQASLAEYRADPEGYKEKKRTWPDARESGPLTKPLHLAYHRNLIAAIDALTQKMTLTKRQFNSLLELDNCLITSLGSVRQGQGADGPGEFSTPVCHPERPVSRRLGEG